MRHSIAGHGFADNGIADCNAAGHGPIGWLLLAALAALLASCEPPPAGREPPPARAAAKPETFAAAPEPAAAANPSIPVIVALGDSLTAGLGLAEQDAYPAILQEKLDGAGHLYRVVNAGVSGDTSAGGLGRMDWLLQQPVAIFIVALGANDGLRGVSVPAMRGNLARIVEKARAAGARVLLAGMRLPSNYGRDYIRSFEAVFPELAGKYNMPFLPFLLEGVAMQGALNQADGIHPNAEGAKILAENVWRVLRPMLEW